MYNKIIWIVLDSVGVGCAPDAEKYGDLGANTLRNTCIVSKPKLDNLAKIGLYKVINVKDDAEVVGAFGRAIASSAGKDTTTGHWEMAGLQIDKPFPTYPEGFPKDVMDSFKKITGKEILGNCVASGTEIINRLGDEHVKTGYPILYTSADSVFQVACHEKLYPIEKIYDICEKAREILVGEHGVGRVIARPFVGENGKYKRTENRRDFSLKPFGKTILDFLKNEGLTVYSVGKIYDIFMGAGITEADYAHGNSECIKATFNAIEKVNKGLIFTNLVDFDMLYGHRRDVNGYAEALYDFDIELKKIQNIMDEEDLLIITADHGCDPTFIGTDHTREMIPIFMWNKKMNREIHIGTRKTFRDIAATIAENFGIKEQFGAKSFYKLIKE
ncbi:MAG: phosphopentomutase [Christensenellaceae bacterium]|nr:phosphopentomutase [Christensenellaceae bacterium]